MCLTLHSPLRDTILICLCLEGSCLPDSSGNFYIYFVWGTSAAAPSFASIMALVDQQMATLNPTQGPRQGQADYVLYPLAAAQEANAALTGQCNGSNTTTLPNITSCVFNDVTVGNNSVPGEVDYGLASADYQAGVGYDMASGLGSVNVANLVNQWNSITSKLTATTTTLTLNSSTTLVHGTPLSFTAAVAPSGGTGTPSGDVALDSFLGLATRSSRGIFYACRRHGRLRAISSLPGGTYTLTAQYSGDSNFAPSLSEPTALVTVTPEPSTTTLSVLTFNQNGNPIPVTSEPFGTFIYLRADVAGVSGHGIPTGGVTFSDTFGAIPGVQQSVCFKQSRQYGDSERSAHVRYRHAYDLCQLWRRCQFLRMPAREHNPRELSPFSRDFLRRCRRISRKW